MEEEGNAPGKVVAGSELLLSISSEFRVDAVLLLTVQRKDTNIIEMIESVVLVLA
jgi:hypothetical protein